MVVNVTRRDAIAVDVTFSNTGDVTNTFGVGVSLIDSAGQTWDCWNNNCVRAPGTGINSQSLNPGYQIMHTVNNLPIPDDMPLGYVDVVAVIWQNATVPPTGELARSTLLDEINVVGIISAQIVSVAVRKL